MKSDSDPYIVLVLYRVVHRNHQLSPAYLLITKVLHGGMSDPLQSCRCWKDNLEPDVGIELLTLKVTNCTGAAREKHFDHREGANGKPFRGTGNTSESMKKRIQAL